MSAKPEVGLVREASRQIVAGGSAVLEPVEAREQRRPGADCEYPVLQVKLPQRRRPPLSGSRHSVFLACKASRTTPRTATLSRKALDRCWHLDIGLLSLQNCLVEICLMHPLDVVKTRFQIQRCATDPNSYKSLGDSFRMIFQVEGLFGFYKGILPPILAETPKRAVKFFTFEQYKKLLGYVSLSPALTFTIAGLGSGLTEAIIVNPFEVVKVGLQANRNTFAEQPSTIGYARQIIKKEGWGLQGLNKGLTATLGRHGVFNMVYFGFYYNVKNMIPVNKDPTLEFLRKFGIGLLSGTIASVINIPFDVAKSRIQGPQPVPGEIKYRTCFKTMATVYQEEGILALYKGLLPKIMRLGPGGAVMLLVYEYTYSWLQENW
ncbi:mitochondrial 2-oxodicarboxylate carrier isoform X1 [Callithrix jacchus]|uniref:mitochondrial 2-oxodicarboxylate carrier isoform X1 n=1 Tax=Callithrix jacchus TaxID=9483 RepID=UPI00159E3453|nr:mitochondrial 2-oxodicarboxylate carrier isoform X1 [Callithrix jacchus]